MCFYIICPIHVSASQLSQCTFCDPSVRLQEQRKEWHFSQALTALDCPSLFKTGAVPCQKSHPLESRKGRSSPSLSLKLQLEVIWAPFTSPMPGSVLSRGLLEAAACRWGDGCCPPASCFCCARKQGNLGCSLHVGNNTQEGVLRLNTL